MSVYELFNDIKDFKQWADANLQNIPGDGRVRSRWNVIGEYQELEQNTFFLEGKKDRQLCWYIGSVFQHKQKKNNQICALGVCYLSYKDKSGKNQSKFTYYVTDVATFQNDNGDGDMTLFKPLKKLEITRDYKLVGFLRSQYQPTLKDIKAMLIHDITNVNDKFCFYRMCLYLI